MKTSMIDKIVWGLVGIVYFPVLYVLYKSRWDKIDYTHAYFILPVSIWLVWRMRKTLFATKEVGASSAWLIALIVGLIMLVFGWRMDYLMVSSLSLIPVLYGLSGYLYGTGMVKLLNFPILYLLLMVPPPVGVLDSITLPMRYAITVLTEVILKALHYPIVRDGLLLKIGGNDIYMGAPCSGFRSLITMIALGLVYAYINKGSLKKKVVLFCSVIPFALLGNLLRVTSMCLVTFYFGEKVGHTYHDYSGYVIFLVLIAGLVGLDSMIKDSL